MTDWTTVVGIDPSLTSTGVAVCGDPFNRDGVTTHRFQSKGTAADDWDTTHRRIGELRDRVLSVVPRGALVLIESPAYSKNTGKAYDRAWFWRDISRDAHDRLGCTVVPVLPNLRAKYGTGAGGGAGAGKDRVLAAAVKRYPAYAIEGNDVADAVLLMAMGRRLVGRPLESALPQANLAALTSVRLPAPVTTGA